jgi:hydrogenase maturation protein HypF
MAELQGVSIHITGIVQGVGFRPFVYGLAIRFGIRGWVRNSSAGVDIEAEGAPDSLGFFIRSLKSELPPMARIDSFIVTEKYPQPFVGFEIISSETVAGAFQPISPDVCICTDCLRELFDPSDRRYRYPFINCTNCGPRFTIIHDIPYDRSNTTMSEFAMCPDCAKEYADPADRRFHAQPIACKICGPQVWLELNNGKRIGEQDDAIIAAQSLLADGKVVAVKGLGGFHLACDATNPDAVKSLRLRKMRVDKPFALMMDDISTIEQHCCVDEFEKNLLISRQRPIVVLLRKPGSSIVEEVAPKQISLGVMLPYTPLHYLLFSAKPGNRNAEAGYLARSLVMTSGNISEEPIATQNDEARQRLSSLADAFLMHDRGINTRCDDSVIRVVNVPEGIKDGTNEEKTKQADFFLRRSRGYAPDPIKLPYNVTQLLATGSDLKNTFCLSRENYAFLSHHIGDMENYDTLQSFENGIEYFENLFRVQPKAIACDLHPDFMSSRYALRRSREEQLLLYRVQHHHAHIAACMAENGLDGSHPVIGLAFDGTGYGEDSAIWGGEFLIGGYVNYQRLFHFNYFPLPGGDAAIKRPSRTALALLWSLGIEWDNRLPPMRGLGLNQRHDLLTQLERGINTVPTSSLGRLFDAAAALVGIRQSVNYEAQAAIEFEALVDPSEKGSYRFEMGQDVILVGGVIRNLLEDFRSDVPIPVISARFHNGLAVIVLEACTELRSQTGIRDVALSGGVWQNKVLLERVIAMLHQNGFCIYIHHQVPTNDGGVSLGQIMVGAARFDV